MKFLSRYFLCSISVFHSPSHILHLRTGTPWNAYCMRPNTQYSAVPLLFYRPIMTPVWFFSKTRANAIWLLIAFKAFAKKYKRSRRARVLYHLMFSPKKVISQLRQKPLLLYAMYASAAIVWGCWIETCLSVCFPSRAWNSITVVPFPADKTPLPPVFLDSCSLARAEAVRTACPCH